MEIKNLFWIVIVIALSVGLLLYIEDHERNACEQKGGEYHEGRNSFCVKPNSLIK